MTEPIDPSEPAVDAGHLLPPEVWALVVEGARRRAESLELPAHGVALIDRIIAARSHGGKMLGGPRLGVIHSAETPLEAGYAYSIAANWFATVATTSATVMIDPAETIRLLPDDTIAWHVGPAANPFTVGAEQAGRASMTRAEWLTPAGRAQMERVADYMRDVRDAWGLPLRWATDAEIRAAAQPGGPRVGWCTHADIARVLGGTTHTDPGGQYPRDELMSIATGGVSPTTGDDELSDPNVVRVIQETANGVQALIGVAARPLEVEARLTARLDALGETVRQLAAGQGVKIDLAAIEAAAERGVARAIESIETTVTVRPALAPLHVVADRIVDAVGELEATR